jgi:AcrR family transcriptional regulator
MGRKAHFDKEHFVQAAMEILSKGSPNDVTMQAVAERAGGPIGSLYHRFASRDHLMAEVWITVVEKFQAGFLEKLVKNDIKGAALHTPQWVRQHLSEARVLLLHRREDLITGDWPEEMKDRAARLAQELDEGLRTFIKRHFSDADSDQGIRIKFALIDVPFGSVRRYLDSGREIPPLVDDLVLETVAAILGERI